MTTQHPEHTGTPDQTPITDHRSKDRSGGLQALASLLTSPARSFEIIGRCTPWAAALVLLAAGRIALGALMAPFGLQAMRAQLAAMMPDNPDQVDLMMGQMEQAAAATRWLSIAAGPLVLAIGLLVQTLLVWLLAIAFQGRVHFAPSFSLVVNLGLILHLKEWANFALLHVRGMDAIRSQLDLQAPMGLDLLLTADSAALGVVYASINPFTIWHLGLLAAGAAAVLRVPQRNARLLAVFYWAATTALAAATTGLAARLMPT